MKNEVEIVVGDRWFFRVNAMTLEPITTTYYDPYALRYPSYPQMGYDKWLDAMVARAGAAPALLPL